MSDHTNQPSWITTNRLGEIVKQKGPNRVYDPVRRCIYCGTTRGPLGKEHIIPFGLGGNMILPRASCTECAKITGAIEQTCLRRTLGPLRIHLALPTRRPKERPTTLTIPCVHLDGRTKSIEVPANEYPIVVNGLVLPLPEIFRPEGASPMGHVWHKVVIRNSLIPVIGADWRADLNTVEIETLIRFFAKVAHSYAVAEWGFGSFKPLVTDLILGKSGIPVCKFVGGGDARITPEVGARHQMVSEHVVVNAVDYLIVSIRLFAELGAPECMVVVGQFDSLPN